MRFLRKIGLGAALCAILALPAVGRPADPVKAKLKEGVRFTNCAACHGPRAVLPPGHVSVSDEKNRDCATCHKDGKTSLRARVPLSHVHLANDVACTDCHDRKPFAFVSTDRCRECHGAPKEVAALTRTDEAFNPHESPHYGNDMDCDLCHHLHAKSENVCGECHDLESPTP